jgi:hypothetical protein
MAGNPVGCDSREEVGNVNDGVPTLKNLVGLSFGWLPGSPLAGRQAASA